MGGYWVLIAVQLLIDVCFAAWLFCSIRDEKKAKDSALEKAGKMLNELHRRVDDVEKALDEAVEKRKNEFDIPDGLEGILSYNPYDLFQKGGDVNAE